MKILIPVDFSEVSTSAVTFACDLFPEAQLQVVHVASGLLLRSEQLKIKPAVQHDSNLQDSLDKLMKHHFKDTRRSQSLAVKVIYGEIVSAITQEVERFGYDAIVMGTKDKYKLFDRLMGTVSLGVIKSVAVPVYLVPRFARYQGFSKVVIASDRHMTDTKVIDFIKSWNRDNAFLKFVHIRKHLEDDFNQEEQKIFDILFGEREPAFGFDVSVIDATDVTSSLLTLASKNQADLLISIPGKQGFLQSLLSGSTTKEFIERSSLPMLFISPNAIGNRIWTDSIRNHEKYK